MLRGIFEKFRKPKREPIILLNMQDNDPTRGDMHGYSGIARHMADIVGGRVETVDDDSLMQRYPDAKTPAGALSAYLEENGYPDIYFGKSSKRFQAHLLQNGTDYVVDILNETFARLFTDDGELVPHHLDAAELERAGAAFERDHPDCGAPMITLFMAAAFSENATQMAERLTDVLKHTPDATLFVCTSWRTDDDTFDAFMKKLKLHMDASGLRNHVETFELNAERAAGNDANPYRGLLHKSDHCIVWGESRSMVSEVLATGKTPYILEAEDRFEHSIAKRLVKRLDAHPKGRALATDRIAPVDVTRDIADNLVGKYQNARRIPRSLRGNFL